MNYGRKMSLNVGYAALVTADTGCMHREQPIAALETAVVLRGAVVIVLSGGSHIRSLT